MLLAVFLGPLTWVYTIRRDRKKFVVGLTLSSTTTFFILLGEQLLWVLQEQLPKIQMIWEIGLAASE